KKEEEIKKVVRKSIIAKTNIPKGTIITKNMLVIKRPGTGIEPKDINKVIGKRIKKDIEKDNIIKWDNIAEG
ncbi:MAG: N-acetylneuraminate synthase, partial [Candidatus Aenigmarchaeota archaeon]|nr:N-acetylneuraminate synthase [Candidatus Aenigmarchaeota archaeon]